MSDDRWNAFKQDTRDAILRDAQGDIHVTEQGESAYSGAVEECYRIWAEVDERSILRLEAIYSAIATEYGQWGIALSFVATHIISGVAR